MMEAIENLNDDNITQFIEEHNDAAKVEKEEVESETVDASQTETETEEVKPKLSLRQQFDNVMKSNNFKELNAFIDNNYVSLESLAIHFINQDNVIGFQYLLYNYLDEIQHVTYKSQTLLTVMIQLNKLDLIKLYCNAINLNQIIDTTVKNNKENGTTDGVLTDKSSNYYYNPLYTAVVYKNTAIIKYFINNYPILSDTKIPVTGNNVAHLAVLIGNIDILLLLLSKIDTYRLNHLNNKGLTPLHLAVMTRDINMIKMLVEAGCDVSVLNYQSKTAFEIALDSDFEEVVAYLEKHNSSHFFENIEI